MFLLDPDAVVSCAKTSLPRSLDVPVSLSRSVAETATDMTMMCFVTPGVAFPPGNDRVQFFGFVNTRPMHMV